MDAGQITKTEGMPPLPAELIRGAMETALEAAIAYLKLNPYEYDYRRDHGTEWERSQAWERWVEAQKALEEQGNAAL